jgi:nucleoside-diphosphate-sugar epimerase
MKILITGANGFIGSALCSRLSVNNTVIGIDITAKSLNASSEIIWEEADISDFDSVTVICKKYSPDVVIHCAGIAHQKMGVVDSSTYMRVNSKATENLAKTVAKYNPAVWFIFLSSVSVYGERRNKRLVAGKNSNKEIDEEDDCQPSSDYAISKLNAEKGLNILYDKGIIQNLVILRLAPVYDSKWSLNLDRRIFAPKRAAYLRFGSGLQRMSALARSNLVDFIEFLIHKSQEFLQTESIDDIGDNNLHSQCNMRINVSDTAPYAFNSIIKVSRRSGVYPKRPVISVPLFFIWLVTRIAGILVFNKKKWIYSCYDKLASDLVFDNKRMLKMGFKPRHSLETIFKPQSKEDVFI